MTLAAKPLTPRRILVRGVNWLGDAIMTTPALQRLRERFPSAHITLLTPDKLAELWARHPAVDQVITFGPHETVWQIARRLGQGGFDLGIALPNSPRSAMELWLARIPRRLGYGDSGRRWLLTDAVEPRTDIPRMHKRSESEVRDLVAKGVRTQTPVPPEVHHVHHYLHLLAALGVSAEPLPPYVVVGDDEVRAVREKFGMGTPGLWLGLNAGAEYGPAKRWPKERFIEAAIALQTRTQCRWAIVGGKADIELATAIASQIPGGAPVVNLAGKTTLRELCAVFKACRVVLTNDTGPMHVAAAVGTPVVVPFGSTSPEFTGPGLPGDPHNQLMTASVPCAPCFLRECPIDFRCMLGIQVATVVEKVLACLSVAESQRS